MDMETEETNVKRLVLKTLNGKSFEYFVRTGDGYSVLHEIEQAVVFKRSAKFEILNYHRDKEKVTGILTIPLFILSDSVVEVINV